MTSRIVVVVAKKAQLITYGIRYCRKILLANVFVRWPSVFQTETLHRVIFWCWVRTVLFFSVGYGLHTAVERMKGSVRKPKAMQKHGLMLVLMCRMTREREQKQREQNDCSTILVFHVFL
jgi:hypothetical protein